MINNEVILSILMQGRNDDYFGDFIKKINFSLGFILKHITNLKLSDKIEIIVCDWGSDDNKKLENILNFKHKSLKFVHVKKDIALKYEDDYSCPHAYNTAARKANGKFILLMDSDIIILKKDFSNLFNIIENMDENKFYWGSRVHIPKLKNQEFNEIDEIEKYLNNTKDILKKDHLNFSNFVGAASTLLLSRNMYYNSTGLWEKLSKWGWFDIEFHNRLATKYICGGELDATFYHLEHYNDNSRGVVRSTNPQINSYRFNANDDNWGLIEENLEVV